MKPEVAVLDYPAPHRRIVRAVDNTVIPIIGIDPGTTTGWSLLVLPHYTDWDASLESILRQQISWQHGQVDCRDESAGVFQLFALINGWPNARVVIEDFILRDIRREKTRELLSPVRIAAMLAHHLWMQGRTPVYQSPANAKTTVTDSRLKLWGIHTTGHIHARDADRHVVLYLRRMMQDRKLR